MKAYLKSIEDIKEAVDKGFTVHVDTDNYVVIKDSVPQYLIHSRFNNHYIGLHGMKGTPYERQLNGGEFYFYL